jgi:hypothetical protein
MQLEVVHALRPVESSDAREGRQSLRCNDRTRRRIAAGRELALMWLEERGWVVVVASEIDLPLRSPLPCMNRNIGCWHSHSEERSSGGDTCSMLSEEILDTLL